MEAAANVNVIQTLTLVKQIRHLTWSVLQQPFHQRNSNIDHNSVVILPSCIPIIVTSSKQAFQVIKYNVLFIFDLCCCD